MARRRSPALLALSMIVVLLASFLTQMSLVPAANAQTSTPGGLGDPVSITDANGNTVTYTLEVQSTGTGHGTNQQCYLNSTTGYSPADDTADDDYFCINDSVTYKLTWNADIRSLNPSPVAVVRFDNIFDGQRMTFNPNTRWSFDGALGGTSVGFLGTTYTSGGGSPRGVDMTFVSIGTRAGDFTFTMRPEDTPGGLDTRMTVTFGGESTTTRADRIVHAIGQPRHDLTHHLRLADPTLTAIEGGNYQGLLIRTNLHPTVGGPERTQYPGYHADKGYRGRYGQKGYFPAQDLRWGLVDPPAGTLASIDGGTPQPLTLDPDLPYVDGVLGYVLAPQASEVKFFMPWDSLVTGVNEFTTRIDPLPSMIDYTGTATMEGGPDPGSTLACSVTTAGVKPGSRIGGNGLPNNNCGLTVVDKRDYDGTFDKRLINFGGVLTLPDGTRDTIGRTAVNNYSRTNLEREFLTAQLQITPPPVGQGKDIAVCDVWDSSQQILRNTNLTANDQPLASMLPMAQVYYTTSDLRPAGAPLGADWDPLCGRPDDGNWSATPPADLSTVSGVMIVIPGDDTLQQPVTFKMQMRTRLGSDYANLITPNVRDYMGYSTDTTVAEPVWSGDSEHFTVYRSWWQLSTGFESASSLPIGRTTYTTNITPNGNYHGAALEGGVFVERIYLDHCMNNPSLVPGSSVTEMTFHQGVQDPALCGTLSDSYYELTRVMPADYQGDRNFDGSKLTWTTPVDSGPGDTYTLLSVWDSPDRDEIILITNDTGYPKTYTVESSSVIGAEKITDDDVIEIGDSFTHTVGWFNYSAGTTGRTQFIDVLPWVGDGRTPATDHHGDLWLESVTQAGGPAGLTTVEYTFTPHSEVVDDPAHPSNQPGGSTTWCSGADLGSAGCPDDVREVTSLRFTTADFSPGVVQYFDLNFGTSGNLDGDTYTNRISQGVSDLLALAVPQPAPVTTVVVDSSISGTVFVDRDRSAAHDGDPTEPTLSGYVVELVALAGEQVVGTSVTDENGDYVFDGLHSGLYQVRVVNDGPYPVITVVGDNTGGLAAGGWSHVIDLGVDTDLTDVDAGLWAPATISGTVYEDLDRSGDQEGEEPGVPEMTVVLLDADGNDLATTQTGPDGWYSFTGLDAGSYTVAMTTPDGRIVTQVWTVSEPGGVPGTVPDAVTDTVDLPFAGSVTEVDFGLALPQQDVTVTKVDAAGQGVPGASFTLYTPAADGGLDEVVGGVVTQGDGVLFSAAGLLIGGEYVLVETTTAPGHNLLAEPIVFTVTAEGVVLTGGTPLVTVDGNDPFRLVVVNVAAVTLPNTGGVGAGGWTALASVLLGGAAVLLLLLRRSAATG